ncbi:hypothetical protein V6N13_064792 [Hibiscus sabdariffa]
MGSNVEAMHQSVKALALPNSSILGGGDMGKAVMLPWILGALAVLSVSLVKAEDPYFYYTWTVTYGTRSVLGIPQQVLLPVEKPDGDFTLLIGDWYKTSHKTLQQSLDSGMPLPFPDGVLINGQTQTTFSGDQGSCRFDCNTYSFGHGQWTPNKRKSYNLIDALTRHTTQVYPNSWTAILISMDNQGMWNLSLTNEYDIPSNVLLCGKAVGIRT